MRIFLFGLALLAPSAAAAQSPPDFVLSEAYLHDLARGSAAVVDIPVVLTHRTSNVHSLASDCEMHLAGAPAGAALADPSSVGVAPPNLCKLPPTRWPGRGAAFDPPVLNPNCAESG